MSGMRPRPITALVAANLRRQVKDRVGLFFIVVMPILTILFVGMALGGTSGTGAMPVGVVAQDSDPVAAALLRELAANPKLEVQRHDTEDELRDGVRRGALAAGLVVRPDDPSLDLVTPQGSGSALAARSEIDVAVGKVSAVREATRAALGAGATPELAEKYVSAAQAESGDVAIRRSGQGSDTPTGFAYTAPANLLLFTFVNSLAVAAALVESRRIGMVRRALATPVGPGRVLAGEALSRFLVAVSQSLLIIVVSRLLFDVRWGDPLAVAAVVTVFCLVATGAAMLVGALVRSPQQAPAIGPPVGIVLGMLGGCLWPREVAGETLTTIGYLFPHSWALDALLALSTPGTGVGAVLTEIGVLAGMAAVVLGVALVVFRRRALALR
jgi:ABC-2 type transport system permease protein